MGSEVLTYLRLGVHHIADLRGYDHILFVAALTIAYRPGEWRRLLWLVTAFTLGHSVTLALATLDLVRVSPALVEPAIAATIVATSLLAFAFAWRAPAGDGGAGSGQGQALRYTVAAAFGLIHGLGFSGYLRSLLGDEESLLVPLVSSHVGRALGQLLMVAVVLGGGALVARGLRRSRRGWVLAASAAIASLGAYVLFERVAA